jgi:DNA integrity scanning protein DisA with diadenylate cyclase activity
MMISTTEIKQEIQLILRDYKQTMTKDLEQALENLHDEIESDKE